MRLSRLGTSLVVLVATATHGACAAMQPIPPAYAEVAAATGVPAEALYALAITGSGSRFNDGCIRPWPWTLTIDGKTERYPTRAEAHAALAKAVRQGSRIRIGLMQLDWRRYRHYLGAPWAALDASHSPGGRCAGEIPLSSSRLARCRHAL